jgi:hypothetical protein
MVLSAASVKSSTSDDNTLYIGIRAMVTNPLLSLKISVSNNSLYEPSVTTPQGNQKVLKIFHN